MKYLFLLLLSVNSFAGIKKSFETPTGYTMDHMEIVSVEVDYLEDKMDIMVGFYKDKAARLAGKSPVKTRRYKVDIPTKVEDPSIFYPILKAMDEFNGAIDD